MIYLILRLALLLKLENFQKSGTAVTGKNTIISRDFLVWKFCGKAQFQKMTRKSENSKAKDYKRDKRKIEEEQIKDLQVSNKLASDEKNKDE